MAKLKSIEKKYIEDFLEMESGYILSFSNSEFERFVYDSIGIEIYEGEGYQEYCSKAKKMRQILEEESDIKVAQLLSDLLEHKSYRDSKRADFQSREVTEFDKKLETEVKGIIQKLCKGEVNVMAFPDASSNNEFRAAIVPGPNKTKEYDVFISHASEDKQNFVEPLTNALKEAGINTWYDADQIGWGESIRQSIDKGLINSRFCIVVLSRDFFEKYWAGNYELNAIFQRAALEKNPLILPIRHNVTLAEISQYNLTLPDIKALDSSRDTLEQIVKAMKDKITRI